MHPREQKGKILQRFGRTEQSTKTTCTAMRDLLVRWADDERGATAVEYGLIATTVFITAVASFYLFGDSLGNMYTSLANTIASVLI